MENNQNQNNQNIDDLNDQNNGDNLDLGKNNEGNKKEKLFSQEELNAIIQKEKAKLKKQYQKEVEEAEKLAKLSEEEKTKYELEKYKKELEELKIEKARTNMSRQIRSILKEDGIVVDDSIIETLIDIDSSEKTLSNTKAFSSMYQTAVQDGVKSALAGTTPKAGKTAKLTKEEILAISSKRERIKAIQENIDLFE